MKGITLAKISVRHQANGVGKALEESFDGGVEYALKDMAAARLHQLEDACEVNDNLKVRERWGKFDEWRYEMQQSFRDVDHALFELEDIMVALNSERGDQMFTKGFIEGYKLAKLASGGI